MKTFMNISDNSFTRQFVIILLIIMPWTIASADDFTKTYKEKYTVEKGAELRIQNKFGDIQCLLWDENSVSILVTVKVEASSQEKADKTFSKIDVALSGTSSKVEGITSVGSISNVDFSIDYEIRMPRWINLNFDNRFGNISLSETEGIAKINLEYGAMEVQALNGQKSELTIKFSDVEVTKINNAVLRLEYSEWESSQAENIDLYSRFSEVTMKDVSQIKLDSQYDEVKIIKAGNVIAVSRFSELDFDAINGDFDFDLQYGEMSANYISNTFKTGQIRNTFASVDLTFDPKASINLDAEAKFGEISLPKSRSSVNEETIDYTTHIYKGKLGASGGIVSQLSIVSKNADVDISFAE